MFKFLKAGFVITFCMAVSLVSDAKVEKKDLLTLDNQENGGILLSFLVDRHCNSKQHFTIQNIESKEDPIKVVLKDKLKDSKSKFKQRYGVKLLPPGNYFLTGGECYAGGSNGYSLTYYDDIQPWFKPFTVEVGKISFLGTITHETVSYKVDGILDFIPDFITKPPKHEYRIYDIEDDLDDVLKKMEKKQSEIIPYVDKNLVDLRLNGDVVKNFVRESYQPKDGEKRIDGRLASRNLRLKVSRYMRTGNK